MFAPKEPVNQELHWDTVYRNNTDFFGNEASPFAQRMFPIFQHNAVQTLLELGAGQGRDTLFFAQNGFDVLAFDYAAQSVHELRAKAESLALTPRITVQQHDVRVPLNIADNSIDACYSHMLLCMQLDLQEILFVLKEIHRVLRPGGFTVYSVRTNFDPHYGAGRHIQEQMYEVGGFIIHFFNEDMVRHCAVGYDIQSIERMEDGSLPRDLFAVVMQKAHMAGV